MLTSSQVVNGYSPSAAARAQARWDFEEEHPLRDARGFDLSREAADPSQLTDEEIGLANVILTNGARLYVDHAHPEYSAPECTNPRDVVVWDKAGELVIIEGARRPTSRASAADPVQEQHRQQGRVVRLARELPDARRDAVRVIVRHLTPFFVSRQVVTGAGRVGIGQDGTEHGFQISQRADYFEVEVGLETTLKRPIINTRDEPHAEPETVPPPARDHRRREPVRDLDVPEGRYDVAGAGDDRGRLADRRPGASTARSRAARGQPRPDAART